jgi:hypothetical protein
MQVSDYCSHPNDCIVYYSEIDEDGAVYEDYWCAACRFWLTSGVMMEIRERPDFDGPISEDDLRRREAAPQPARD